MSFGTVARAQDGAAVYLAKCAPCHGDEGGGDGPGAETMLPRPRVLAGNFNYKFRSTENAMLPTRDDLYGVITNGIPGTAMRNFGHLTEQTRWALVDHVESLSDAFADPEEQEGRAVLPIGTPPPITDELIARGHEVYTEQKCYECHGEEGRGDWPGWNEKTDAWDDVIVPANLTRWDQLRNGSDIEDLFRTTLTGLNGTPMPNTEMSEEDRWALSAWMQSIQQPRPETQDQVVLAVRLEELPASIDDEAWNQVPSQMFPLVGQVVQKPRLFWPSVTEIFVQAAHDEEDLVLLLQWDDRDQSAGTNLEEFSPDQDPITDIFAATDFPDQAALQFPAGNREGDAKPYFLWGDADHDVNLWWWSSADGRIRERNAAGTDPQDQGEESQQLQGSVHYEDGRYRMIVRRALSSRDPRDVQFTPGAFVPVAFNVWQGSRGEIGTRRAITTWYSLVVEPPVPLSAYALPPITSGLALALLLFIVTAVYRSEKGLSVPPAYRVLGTAMTVGAVGALVIYTTGPAIYRFLTKTQADVQLQNADARQDEELRSLRAKQQSDLAAYRWVDAGAAEDEAPDGGVVADAASPPSDTEPSADAGEGPRGDGAPARAVTLPIDVAMQRVVEEARGGDETSLVPALGPQDQPTMPAVVPE